MSLKASKLYTPSIIFSEILGLIFLLIGGLSYRGFEVIPVEYQFLNYELWSAFIGVIMSIPLILNAQKIIGKK